MSRLIDADSYLKNFCNRYCGVKQCTSTQKKSCCIAISLNDEPTAFDVDKVVERLKTMHGDLPFNLSHCHEFYIQGKSNGLIEAIGIVRAGEQNER